MAKEAPDFRLEGAYIQEEVVGWVSNANVELVGLQARVTAPT